MKTLKICMVLALISSVFTIGIIVTENVSAAEIPVSPGNGTITAALAGAQDGDTLILGDGNYFDNVDVNKRVIIESQSSNPFNVAIFPSNTNLPVFDINIDSVEISHLTIQGTSEVTPSECGVRSDVTAREHYGVLLEDLRISLFKTGIKICRTNTELSYPRTHEISECTIFHNNKGVYIEADPDAGPSGSTCTVIDDSEIYENTYYSTFSNYYGVEIHGDLNYIKNSDIYGHQQSQAGIGVILINADYNTIYGLGEDEYSNINHNDLGLYFDNSNFNLLDQSNIKNNAATGYGSGGTLDGNIIHLDSDSNSNEITDCTITTNHEDDISCILISDSDSNTLDTISFDGSIYLTEDSDLNSFDDVDDIISICMNGNSDANSFSYCTITGNNGGYITAISIDDCDNIGESKISFSFCDIGGNYGFDIDDSSGISITNCDIDAETYGFHISYSANILVQNCEMMGPDTGFHIKNSNNVEIYDDTFSELSTWVVFINCQVKIEDSVFNDVDGLCDMIAMVTSSTVWYQNLYLGVSAADLEEDFHWQGEEYMTFVDLSE